MNDFISNKNKNDQCNNAQKECEKIKNDGSLLNPLAVLESIKDKNA